MSKENPFKFRKNRKLVKARMAAASIKERVTMAEKSVRAGATYVIGGVTYRGRQGKPGLPLVRIDYV